MLTQCSPFFSQESHRPQRRFGRLAGHLAPRPAALRGAAGAAAARRRPSGQRADGLRGLDEAKEPGAAAGDAEDSNKKGGEGCWRALVLMMNMMNDSWVNGDAFFLEVFFGC